MHDDVHDQDFNFFLTSRMLQLLAITSKNSWTTYYLISDILVQKGIQKFRTNKKPTKVQTFDDGEEGAKDNCGCDGQQEHASPTEDDQPEHIVQ